MLFGGKEKSTRKERERERDLDIFKAPSRFFSFPLLFFGFFPLGLAGFLSFIIRFP